MISSKEIGFELEVHLYKFPLWLKENIEDRENLMHVNVNHCY